MRATPTATAPGCGPTALGRAASPARAPTAPASAREAACRLRPPPAGAGHRDTRRGYAQAGWRGAQRRHRAMRRCALCPISAEARQRFAWSRAWRRGAGSLGQRQEARGGDTRQFRETRLVQRAHASMKALRVGTAQCQEPERLRSAQRHECERLQRVAVLEPLARLEGCGGSAIGMSQLVGVLAYFGRCRGESCR